MDSVGNRPARAIPHPAQHHHARSPRPQTPENNHDPLPDSIEIRRQVLTRFRNAAANLPFPTQATCPRCQAVVSARFDWSDKRRLHVVLRFDCPDCGHLEELHDDQIWCPPHQPDRPGSARATHAGIPIRPNARSLPRTVETLCPTCAAVIPGRLFICSDQVRIEKTCPEHGYCRDLISRDPAAYLRAAQWSFDEQPGLTNPARPHRLGCPSDCGLCAAHQSGPCLANLDLTNRCNLDCPICFANANAAGYLYEPSFEQVDDMLQGLRNLRPTPATAIQFSGGEPTLHPRFFDIVARARDLGFSNIQIATNGLRMADLEFATRARDAGLHTLYLQFDGVGPEPYLAIRGRDIWKYKLAAIENCRKLDLKVCLVPTVIRTLNDDQVATIFRFAVENIDVVSGISYQPVCFTGRIDESLRLQQRYTLSDLARDLAHASGADPDRDFYPLSIVMPLSQFLELVTGDPKVKPSCHTDCAYGTYYLVAPDGQVYPFPRVIDVEALFSGMNRLHRQLRHRAGRLNALDKYRIYRLFKSVFRPENAPPGLDVKTFMATLQGLVDKSKGRGQAGQSNYRTLLAAGMHFMDRYNYDLQRIRRCVIPYATPQGIFPFCAYNAGPTYRPLVEQTHPPTPTRP